MKHNIVLKGYGAYLPTTPSKLLCLGTAESYGVEQLHITPGAGWEGLVIKATFHPASSEPVVMVVGENGGVIDVPPEATAKSTAESSPGVIVFSGVADGVQRISANLAYTVIGHAPVEGKDSEPTPSQWEQLVAQYQSKVDKQQGAENAGKFLAVGENGEVALSEGVKPEQIASAVDAYLDENPIEAGATPEEAAQIRQNKEDIETLQKDKLSASELDSAVNSALAQAKASGEFDGEDGEPFTYEDFTEEQLAALKGKDGDDYVLTEADKAEIAQDAAALVDVPDKLPNPNALTFTGAVSGTYDGSAPLTVEIPKSKEYTLPVASETALGGVKASAKTEDMTQPVGIGEDGFLFTVPGASGSTIPFSNIKLVKRVDLKSTAETEGLQLEVTEDMDGKPLSLKAFIIDTDFSSNVSYNEFDLSYGETMVRMVAKTPLYGFGSGDGVIFILSNDGKHMTCSSGRYNAWYISPLSKAVAHISKIKMGYWKKWTYFRVYEIVDI